MAAFPFHRFRHLRHGPHRPPCPHCAHPRVHRWGGFAGRQRYRCVACRRTFSDFTGTPLAALKHIDAWPAFCRCALESRTVRDTALRIGVHKDTAFRWRHRLLAALDASDTAPLRATVTFGETWFPYSEKGRRPPERPARSPESPTPVWVVVARDGAGRTASGVVGLRRPTATDLGLALGARLSAATTLASPAGPYGAAGLLAVRLGLRYHRPGSWTAEVQALRAYTRALRRWSARFRGIATRYLAHYLAWHRFLDLVVPTPDPTYNPTSGPGPGPGPGPGLLLAARFP